MAFDYIVRIGLLLLFGTIIVLIHNAGSISACWLTDVRVKVVTVFYGKPVFTFRTPLAPIAVGYIPLGGGLEFENWEAFLCKPRWTRCLVFLSGPIAVFLSSLVCLGISRTASSFSSAFPQLMNCMLSPMSYDKGLGLFAAFLAFAQTSPVAGYGILAAKNAALNLLPLPVLPGGRLLLEFIEMTLQRLFPDRTPKVPERLLNYIQSLVALMIIVCLIAGVISFFRKH